MICLLTLTYNEEKILPFFLQHYSKFCDKMIFYDNESTDDTVSIINSFPNTEVITYKTGNQLSESGFIGIKNNSWKINRGYDWQIVVDCDEFLHHEEMPVKEILDIYKLNDVTLVQAIGYRMLSDDYPDGEMINNKYGVQEMNYGKPCIFNPSKIREINYGPGAHMCSPVGEITTGLPYIKLLHYRHFGFKNWKERNDLYVSRNGDITEPTLGAYKMWDEQIKTEEQYLQHFGYDKRRLVI